MQHDLVGSLLSVGGVSLAPVVADRVSEDVSGTVEGTGSDRASDGRVTLETVLGVLIPEVEGAVAAGCAESSVDGVEGDGVDGVDVADVALAGWCLAVALEGEVGGGVLLFDVLNGATTFDGTDGETGGIGKAADYPRLPLEGGLHGLVKLGRLVQVDDVDVAICGTDDEKLVLDIHRVNAFLALHACDWCLLPDIPVLHRLIPRSGDQQWRSAL